MLSKEHFLKRMYPRQGRSKDRHRSGVKNIFSHYFPQHLLKSLVRSYVSLFESVTLSSGWRGDGEALWRAGLGNRMKRQRQARGERGTKGIRKRQLFYLNNVIDTHVCISNMEGPHVWTGWGLFQRKINVWIKTGLWSYVKRASFISCLRIPLRGPGAHTLLSWHAGALKISRGEGRHVLSDRVRQRGKGASGKPTRAEPNTWFQAPFWALCMF